MSMITEFYLAVAVGLILSIAMEEFLGISSGGVVVGIASDLSGRRAGFIQVPAAFWQTEICRLPAGQPDF